MNAAEPDVVVTVETVWVGSPSTDHAQSMPSTTQRSAAFQRVEHVGNRRPCQRRGARRQRRPGPVRRGDVRSIYGDARTGGQLVAGVLDREYPA